MVLEVDKQDIKDERFCPTCETELNPPKRNWLIGLGITLAVLGTCLVGFGFLLWLPFGPLGTLWDRFFRWWRRTDYNRGWNAGVDWAMQNSNEIIAYMERRRTLHYGRDDGEEIP